MFDLDSFKPRIIITFGFNEAGEFNDILEDILPKE
jgi:hypothetical protein